MKEVSKIDSNDVKEKAKQTAKGAAKKVVKRVFTAKVLIALIVVIIFVVLAGSILKLFDFDTHWSEDEPGSPNTYTSKAQLDVKEGITVDKLEIIKKALLDIGVTEDDVAEMSEIEMINRLRMSDKLGRKISSLDDCTAAEILWCSNDVYSKYLNTPKELEYLLNAEIVTQYPKLGLEEGKLDGIIQFKRATGDDSTEGEPLTYIDSEKFEDMFSKYSSDSNDEEILKYFTIDEEGNAVVATWTSSGDSGFTSGKKLIPYKEMIQKLTLPFEYLWTLFIQGQSYDFTKELADLAYNSEIIIGIYDNVTSTTTTVTTTVTESIHTEGEGTEENVSSSTSQTLEKNNNVQLDIMYADVWIVQIVSEYKHDTSEDPPVNDSETIPGTWQYNGTHQNSEGQNVKTTKKVDKSIETTIINKYDRYIKVKTDVKEKTDVDPNTGDNFVKALRRHDSAYAILTKTVYNQEFSWLVKALEKNDDTKNMVELTIYLLNKAIDPNNTDISFDFNSFYIDTSMSAAGNIDNLASYLRQFSGQGDAPKSADGNYYLMYGDGKGWPTIGNADLQWKSHYTKFDQPGKVMSGGTETTVNSVMSFANSKLYKGPTAQYSDSEVNNLQIYIEVELVDKVGSTVSSGSYSYIESQTSGLSLSQQQMYALTAIAYNFGSLPSRNGHTFKEVYQAGAQKYAVNSWQHNRYIWDNWWAYLGGGAAGHIPARDAAFETYVKGVYDLNQSYAGGVFTRTQYIYYTQNQLNMFSYAPKKPVTRTASNEESIFTYVENTTASDSGSIPEDSDANTIQNRIVEIAEAQLAAQFSLPKSNKNYIQPLKGGYCQKFARLVNEKAGAPGVIAIAGTAIEAGKMFGVSEDFSKIVKGACVFGNSKYSPSAGHVGIYDGKGGVISLIKKNGKGVVVKQTLADFTRIYYNGCWGWQSKTPVNSLYPVSKTPLM